MNPDATTRAALVARLRAAGFLEAAAEADDLLATASETAELELLAARRLAGEPIEWLTGRATFGGLELAIGPGVYVPRPQSEPLAARAGARLSALGPGAVGLDLCTGCGAFAAALAAAAPGARVLGIDCDRHALGFARRNGVAVARADLGTIPLAARSCDLVVAVMPYVPTAALAFLPADTLRYEPRAALAGGVDGLVHVRRALGELARVLRAGGDLLLELGGDQDELLAPDLREAGFDELEPLFDEEDDLRGLHARRSRD